DTYAGNITISGGGAADATVAVSGAVLAVPVVTAETFNATVGESFSAQITATDNPTSYAYTGTLPAGLDFNPTTGAITGTPEAAGSFDIQVTATNIVGTSTPATVSIVVAQGVQTLAGFTDINTVLGAADIALPETTNAGLTVSYASSNTAVATVSGNTVSIVGLGTTTITATQAGNANWGAFNEEITLTVIDASSADCFEEDFSDITNGNSTSSTGSNTAWNGNSNFPTVTYAYQAGGKVRLGSSNNNGSITSVALTAFQGQSVTVSFDAKSWATSATSILVTLGTQSQVVELAAPADWESDLTSYEIEFENVEANATLTFASNNNTERRFFLDNIAVCISEVSIDPILNVTSASITGLNYGLGSGPSVAQSFVLSGENLDGSDVTVTAPANFEVSTTEASGYASALTLTAYDGTETTIWVRLAAGQPVDTYAGNITISGGGAADATVAVSGEVLSSDPILTVSEEEIVNLGYTFGAATSVPASFTISGLNMDGSGDVMLAFENLDTDFEMSLAAEGTYTDDLLIEDYDGTETTIYVRLKLGREIGNSYADELEILTDYDVNESVLVFAEVTPPIINTNPDTIVPAMTAIAGETDTETVTVSGTLTADVTAQITGDDAGQFSVTASVTSAGGDLTVTYEPTTVGEHTATLLLSTNGGVTKELALS